MRPVLILSFNSFPKYKFYTLPNWRTLRMTILNLVKWQNILQKCRKPEQLLLFPQFRQTTGTADVKAKVCLEISKCQPFGITNDLLAHNPDAQWPWKEQSLLENLEATERNASNQNFLFSYNVFFPAPKKFQYIVTFHTLSENANSLDKSTILLFGKEVRNKKLWFFLQLWIFLTLSQTTNFRPI